MVVEISLAATSLLVCCEQRSRGKTKTSKKLNCFVRTSKTRHIRAIYFRKCVAAVNHFINIDLSDGSGVMSWIITISSAWESSTVPTTKPTVRTGGAQDTLVIGNKNWFRATVDFRYKRIISWCGNICHVINSNEILEHHTTVVTTSNNNQQNILNIPALRLVLLLPSVNAWVPCSVLWLEEKDLPVVVFPVYSLCETEFSSNENNSAPKRHVRT